MSTLSPKVAIVTGASRGIGAAIATKLAADGAKVVVNYSRSADAADEVVKAISSNGGEAVAVQADLSDAGQISGLFDAAMSRFGRIDILVNNAAVAEMGTPVERVTPEQYRRHF